MKVRADWNYCFVCGKDRWKYDGFGNIAKVDKPDAATIEYTYNKLNQMTQEKFDANNYNDYEYCCCSLIKHQQTIAGSQLNPYELTLDKLHRLTREQYPDVGETKTQYFDYKYDAAGRRVEMTDPTYGRAEVEPKPQRWGYDEDGMLLRVGHTQDDDYLRNRGEDYGVIYDRRGRINRVLYPGENNQPVMEVEYKYNDADQVSAIIARDLTKGAATDIYCMQYDYDTNGRKIRQVIKTGENDPDTLAHYVTTLNYDSPDMLVEEKYLRWDGDNDEWMVMYWARYKYDTAGNMVERDVEQIVNGDTKVYSDLMTYSRGYQLTQIIRTIPGEMDIDPFTYDENGNLTTLPGLYFEDEFYRMTTMEFQYDKKNRLIKYRFGGEGYWNEIKYDALGRVRERLSADETPITKKFYSDGRQSIQQLNDSNDAEFDYLRGPTVLDRQWDETNDTRRFYIKDNLGTVWAMVNPSDLSVKRYNYNAWGEHLDASDPNFPDYDDDPNLMRYIGCRVEAFGTGTTSQRDAIYHLDHRHYLPGLGRFLQREPIIKHCNGEDESPMPYTYCKNRPSDIADPTGLWLVGAIILGFAVLFISGCSFGRTPRKKEPQPDVWMHMTIGDCYCWEDTIKMHFNVNDAGCAAPDCPAFEKDFEFPSWFCCYLWEHPELQKLTPTLIKQICARLAKILPEPFKTMAISCCRCLVGYYWDKFLRNCDTVCTTNFFS